MILPECNSICTYLRVSPAEHNVASNKLPKDFIINFAQVDLKLGLTFFKKIG